MNSIPLINEITNSFNESFKVNLTPLNLESKIRDVGDLFTLKLYESFLITLINNSKIVKKEKKNIISKKLEERL